TITDSLDLPGIQTRTLPKQLRLRFAYKKRIVGTLSHFLFKGAEQFSFTPVYPSHWSRPRVRIAFKFCAIDIGKVHDHPPCIVRRNKLGHLAGKNKNTVNRPGAENSFDIIPNLPAPKRSQRNRLCGDKCLYPRLPIGFCSLHYLHRCKRVLHITLFSGIPFIIGKANQIHRRVGHQFPQDMMRSNFVTPVRRPGNTVTQEQYLSHQPKPLAIAGPSQFATESGSLCHKATCSRYFGLIGLTSRAAAQTAVRMAYDKGSGSKPQFFLKAEAPVPTLERPKSNCVQPRRRAWFINAEYITSLARSLRAS